MAETLISPGVFLQENDLSQITQGPVQAGAALLGPTVTGPVNIPTLVTTYSQYKAVFGAAFVSGGASYEYLTSMAALNYFEQGGSSLLVTRVTSGSYTPATASLLNSLGTVAVVFETLSAGSIMSNNVGSLSGSGTVNGALPTGSSANIRWEVTSMDSGSGIFNLIVRRGDDYQNSKTVLETWNGLSLDPNQSNYVAYVIGDQTQTVSIDDLSNYYLQTSGSYQNKSRYIRVKTVNTPTPGYFNQYGQPTSNQYTASLPLAGSGSNNGSFGTATGQIFGSFGVEPVNFFENIPSALGDGSVPNRNIQGLRSGDYNIAINLMANKDEYDINVLYAPGINNMNAPSQITSIVNTVQTRGDAIAVVDMVGYGQSIPTATTQANGFDNSYAATYYPWLQIRSRETGKVNFVPASTIVPAAYEYNDRVAAEWFAPAGLNRGALSTVLQPERKLTSSDRDRLYQASVNPIATFPGVNVRRLLIALKSYIGQIGESIVFEPNTQVTRNKFISQVNPYLESVQQRQGLYSFQVVMDDTNNTPDVIDRNQLVGSIYLQPTKTAEFIQLDFNILPTGTTFGQ